MPEFPVPEGEDKTSWFIKEVERGLRDRFPNGIPDDVRKQAQYEEDVIISMGFPGYLPHRRRLHQLGKVAGHPRGPRSWFGCWIDGRLRHEDH